MKSRMILPAILAVGLFCLVSISSAQAGLFGHNSGCGCEPTCGVEPACGCEVSCDPCCCPARGPVGPPASQVRCQACLLRARLL